MHLFSTWYHMSIATDPNYKMLVTLSDRQLLTDTNQLEKFMLTLGRKHSAQNLK